MNKKRLENVNTLDSENIQPNGDLLFNNDKKNIEDISDVEYQRMLNEINFFNPNKSQSLYTTLDKNPNSYEWQNRPHITRSNAELYKQLHFYDDLKQKDILNDRQELEVNKQIKGIYNELKHQDQYDYFLKHGYDKVNIDKNAWSNKNKFIKFYQRDENILYADNYEDFIDIYLPKDKWWIKAESNGEFSILRNRNGFGEFVNVNAKLSNTYNADHYIDNIVYEGIKNVKNTTNNKALYEYQDEINDCETNIVKEKETPQVNNKQQYNNVYFNNQPKPNNVNNRVILNNNFPKPPPLPPKHQLNNNQKQFFDYQMKNK